jgi:membrane protease YdiL (CAAX protease family)
MTQPTTSVTEILIGYLSMALLPALLEEWAFRGILLKYLRPYSKIGALVTTSIIFGMMHVDLPRIISASIFGLILGICYDYTS